MKTVVPVPSMLKTALTTTVLVLFLIRLSVVLAQVAMSRLKLMPCVLGLPMLGSTDVAWPAGLSMLMMKCGPVGAVLATVLYLSCVTCVVLMPSLRMRRLRLQLVRSTEAVPKAPALMRLVLVLRQVWRIRCMRLGWASISRLPPFPRLRVLRLRV